MRCLDVLIEVYGSDLTFIKATSFLASSSFCIRFVLSKNNKNGFKTDLLNVLRVLLSKYAFKNLI